MNTDAAAAADLFSATAFAVVATMAAAEAAPAAAEAAAASVFISSWFHPDFILIHPDFILIHPDFVLVSAYKDKYSNRAENCNRPKNREDSSDLDEILSESIAATQTSILKKNPGHTGSKQVFKKKFARVTV